MGYTEFWLETRSVNARAVSFYERRGYRKIPNFGKYIGRQEAVCLGKPLAAARRSAPVNRTLGRS